MAPAADTTAAVGCRIPDASPRRRALQDGVGADVSSFAFCRDAVTAACAGAAAGSRVCCSVGSRGRAGPAGSVYTRKGGTGSFPCYPAVGQRWRGTYFPNTTA